MATIAESSVAAPAPLAFAPDEFLPIVLRLRSLAPMTDDALLKLSSENPDLRIELTAEGDLIVMPPTGGTSGARNAKLTTQLGTWAESFGGASFDSSTGFHLPSGAIRSPDGCWITAERMATLTEKQLRKFPPLCPDFCVELCSATDSVSMQRAKLEEWIANGLRLGWLIDPDTRKVWIYRGAKSVEELSNPATLSGEDVLPGFILDLSRIW